MSILTFEDPRKTDLRERVRLGLEASGFEVTEPEAVAIPEASRLKGKIIGDLQAIDTDGQRHAFYLRLAGDKAIPQWIASLAIASHSIKSVRVHIVVEQSSALLERSCRAAGAGLLVLVSEGDYQLRAVVDGKEYSVEARSAEFIGKTKELRRRIETKMDAHVRVEMEKYAKLAVNTRGMPQARQDEYVEAIEGEIREWKEWGERLFVLLDEAAATLDENVLLTVAKEIEQGISSPA